MIGHIDDIGREAIQVSDCTGDQTGQAMTVATAIAAIRLSFHATSALLEAGLLSPAKRAQCVNALNDLCLEMEGYATQSDQAYAAMAGFRQMAEELSAYRDSEG